MVNFGVADTSSRPIIKQKASIVCKCKCNLFTHGAPRSSKNSFRNACAFQGRIGIWKCWFLRRGENRSTRRKTSWSRVENQQQTQPTYDAGSGNRTLDTLVGGEHSHHCTNPAPLLSGQLSKSHFSLPTVYGKNTCIQWTHLISECRHLKLDFDGHFYCQKPVSNRHRKKNA